MVDVPASESLSQLWIRAFAAAKDVVLQPGLSGDEVDQAEAAYQVRFPPDLRTLLQTALPVDARGPDAQRHTVPNWRNLSDFRIHDRLNAPWLGAVFDQEHNNLGSWLPTWGQPPPTLADRIREMRRHFEAAPRLVPVFSHRYLPSEPHEAGNPVFSVHQLDIIYYCSDLEDYLLREFFRSAEGEWPPFGPIRHVPLWSEFAESDPLDQ